MDDSKWERWGALGGILFVILVVVAGFLPGSPPKTSDSAPEIAKFVADKGDEIRCAGYLSALAAVPFFWWLGSLWRMLRRAEGGMPRLTVMATLGGVFAATIGAIGAIVLAVLPIAGRRGLGVEGMRTFYILATNVGLTTLFGIAILVGASSVVILRSHVLPVVLGWFGVLVFFLALIGGWETVSTNETVWALTFVAFIAATLWVLVTSILMLRPAPEAVSDTA
jgi:hypothetical protein